MYRYSGCKNTFLVTFDEGLFPEEDRNLISSLCRDVDGLLLIRPSKKADVRMVYFNKDGSRAAMCGNGLRCLAHCAQNNLFPEKCSLTIETDIGIRQATIDKDLVEVEMGPIVSPKKITLSLESSLEEIFFLNTGVPHAVIVVDDIDNVDVQTRGRTIRYHPIFGPDGTNVTFTALHKIGIRTRTYERGIEGETLACGTGAAAAALVLWEKIPQKNVLQVCCQSKEILYVRREGSALFLKGEVSCVCP